MRKKTIGRKRPHKVLRLLLTQLPGQSATAAASSSTSSPPASTPASPSPTSSGAPAPAAALPLAKTQVALAPAVPGEEREVNEVASPGFPVGPATQPVPSALEVVIELSDEGEPEGSIPSAGAAPVAPVSIAAPASVASTALDVPGPSAPCAAGSPDTSRDEEITRKLFVELNHEAIGILGDGSLVILSSDSEEEVTEEEEKNEPAGGGSPSRS
ncbi:predicted GPI-anchored protein 58 [Miscanthus floridulus]|uniref:predicted GPI-anchored protein 58 n=1 Tax=Miscanthus floridulus TaxID=154761 RepID=UPI0034589F64